MKVETTAESTAEAMAESTDQMMVVPTVVSME